MQAAKAAPSSWHWKLVNDPWLNAKDGAGFALVAAGALVIDGAVAATVHVELAVCVGEPCASSARTWNVCEPFERPRPPFNAVSACGLEHAVKLPESSRHRNVEYDPCVNAIDGAVLALGEEGFAPMVGALVSTVTVPLASLSAPAQLWSAAVTV